MNRRQMVKLLAAGAVGTASGCFGSFPATMWVFDFNKSLSSSKFVRWLIFLVLTIVPVYAIAVFIDVWVLNSIEFWFGGGDVADGEDPDERTVALDDQHTLYMRKDVAAGRMWTTLYRPQGQPVSLLFEMSDGGARAISKHGELAAVRSTSDGGVEVLTGGRVIQRFDATTVNELQRRFDRGGAAGAAAYARKLGSDDGPAVARR